MCMLWDKSVLRNPYPLFTCLCPRLTAAERERKRYCPNQTIEQRKKTHLAQEGVDLPSKGSDGTVAVADMWSLGVPVVGVLFLHEGRDVLLEGLDDLGSAG